MSVAFLACLAFTLAPAQDGQKLHVTPGDAGGATDDGITLATFRDYRDNPALTAADLGHITDAEVQAIYALKYWNPIRGDDLPPGVAMMVMDHGVTCGPTASGRILQQALGLHGAGVDGWIGPATIELIRKQNASALLNHLAAGQETHYRACRGFGEFGRGWLLRLARRHAAATKLLAGTTADDLNARELAAS